MLAELDGVRAYRLDDHLAQRLERWRGEHVTYRHADQRHLALRGDRTVDDVPEPRFTRRIRADLGVELAPGVEVKQEPGMPTGGGDHVPRIHDKLQAGGRAGQRLVREPRGDLPEHRLRRWLRDDRHDVQIDAARGVGAERHRPGRIHPDQSIAENIGRSTDDGSQVPRFG
jgi:hypothetical protein